MSSEATSRPQRRTLALATPHAAATTAGLEIFAAGGNAVDAMVAACAAIAVAYPHMVSPGGDAFALVHAPGGGVTALNGSGAAPRAIDVDAVRARYGAMPSRTPETVTVPGLLAALDALGRHGGRFDLGRQLAPAIALAADGVPVSRSLAAGFAEYGELVARDPGLSSVFLPTGRRLTEDEIFRQPALARTLESIAGTGVDAFYRTEAMTPLRAQALSVEVLSASPNSRGFALLETLAALEQLGDWIDPLGPQADLLAALFGLVHKDGEQRLGDPRSGAPPLDDLLGATHARKLADAVRRHVGSGGPQAPPGASAVRPGGDTVGLACADSEGYAVAVMASLFDLFGLGVLEPRTGIVCHDRGACFSLEPGSPNLLAPGARPAHTLTPVMVLRDGRLWTVAGSMGGYAQPQIHTQILYQLLVSGLDPQAAVDAPRWTLDVDYSGDPALKLWVEQRVPAACRAALDRTGIPMEDVAAFDEWVGQAHYVSIEADGRMAAAHDPRADGLAVCETV